MVQKFVIFFVLIISIIGNQAYVNNELYDKAVQTYNEIKGKVRQTIDESVAKLNEQLDKTTKLGDETISDGTTKIKETADKYTSEIDKLVAKYSADGINITACANNIKSQMEAARQRITNELTACVNGKVTGAIGTVNSTIPKIKANWNDVEKLGADLQQCGHDGGCLSGLIAKMVMEAVRLPLKITGELMSATGHLTGLDVAIGGCVTGKTLAMVHEGGRLLASVAKCAN